MKNDMCQGLPQPEPHPHLRAQTMSLFESLIQHYTSQDGGRGGTETATGLHSTSWSVFTILLKLG